MDVVYHNSCGLLTGDVNSKSVGTRRQTGENVRPLRLNDLRELVQFSGKQNGNVRTFTDEAIRGRVCNTTSTVKPPQLAGCRPVSNDMRQLFHDATFLQAHMCQHTAAADVS